MTIKQISHIDVPIDKGEVFRWATERGSDFEVDHHLDKVAFELIWEASSLIETKLLYADLEILEKLDDCFAFEGNLNIKSHSIQKVLNDCDRATLFTCTIGDMVEKQAEKYQVDGEDLKAYLMDVIGSVAVEELAEKISEMTEHRARQEQMTTTFRFSPGYGDFNLEYQAGIFNLMKPAKIGITLTDKFIMLPRKSITGIIGWYRVRRVGRPVVADSE